jgi:ABC-type phosphate/phosphonate transport system permease subunit
VKRFSAIILNLLLLGVPALAWGGEGLDVPKQHTNKVDLTNLSGINHFFASWYNDNLWVYATIVTVLMGLVGFCIALVADVVLKMIGMETHKIEHHE